MKNKTILVGAVSFVSGALLGGFAAWKVARNYFQKKADEEIAEVKSAFNEELEAAKAGRMYTTINSADGDIVGPTEIDDDSEADKVSSRSYIRTREEAARSPLNNKPPLTDYTSMFHHKDASQGTTEPVEGIVAHGRDAGDQMIQDELGETFEDESEHEGEQVIFDPAETEAPEDDDWDADEEWELNHEHRDNIDKLPIEISDEDYELTGVGTFDKVCISYYIQDDILVDEDGSILNERELLDDCLDVADFKRNDEDVIYIRNYQLMIDYKVEKIFTEYTGNFD